MSIKNDGALLSPLKYKNQHKLKLWLYESQALKNQSQSNPLSLITIYKIKLIEVKRFFSVNDYT